MDSPDWRSFASHELLGLASDFDLTSQPIQDQSRNGLPEDSCRTKSSDLSEVSAFLHQPSDNYNVEDSENTNATSLHSHPPRSDHPGKGTNEETSSPQMVQTYVNWKGNPAYSLTWDVLGILVSLCFLVSAAFVARLNGQNPSDWSRRVFQVTDIGLSLWPVLFSGVLGNAIRALADWRMERGVDLLTAEQLMGSLTLFNAIATIFRWSILRFSSILIVTFWAFKPLGSQSLLRSIYLQQGQGERTGKISSYNYNLSSQLGMTFFSNESTRATPKMRALYSTVLYNVLSTIQYVDKTSLTYEEHVRALGGEQPAAEHARTDVWGNLRVPNLQELRRYDNNNPHQWVPFVWEEDLQDYSSLVGERIEGIQRDIPFETSFVITSSYQSFKCSPWVGLENATEADRWIVETSDGMNFTSVMKPPYRTSLVPRSFFVAKSGPRSLNASETQNNDYPQLLFGTLGREPFMSVTQCSTRMAYVDMMVACMSWNSSGDSRCRVSLIRETRRPTDPVGLTLLEAQRLYFPNSTVNHDPQIHLGMERSFMDLLDEDMQSRNDSSSFVEWYLRDPLTALDIDPRAGRTDLGKIDIKLFEQRFSLLWNTLWKISTQHESIMNGRMTQGRGYDALVNTTSTTTFLLPAKFAVDVQWMTIYFVSVAVMFSAAVFSLVMHYRCHAPPLLGYVSSLIRDSKYFDDPKMTGNSVESGTEKTKRLHGLRILIGDIKEGEEVGKLALVPVDKGEKMKRRRFYE